MFESAQNPYRKQRDEKFRDLGKKLYEFVDYHLQHISELVDGNHHSLSIEICCDSGLVGNEYIRKVKCSKISPPDIFHAD